MSLLAETRDVAHEPLVSVVLPTHNRARLLERALRNVLAQTHRRLEIIVVDDASADETSAAVRGIGDARIHYLRHTSNKGGAAARNTGILAATGEYIAFLDDDDEWEPDKIEKQLCLMQHYAVTICGYHGEEQGLARRYQSRPTVGLSELRRGFFRGGGTSALMARTHVLREILFDESLPRCQDWDLCIRIAKRYEIGYLPGRLMKYNAGGHVRISNRVQNMPLAGVEQQLRMVQKHKKFFGPRMYRFHMCRLLLTSVRHRPDRMRYVVDVSRRYGVIGVVSALAERVYLKMMQKLALP